jgi:hypothetical protein
MATIPSQAKSKQLRACLLCSIIQHPMDFRKNGCPNCEEIMQVCVEIPLITSTHLFPWQMKGSPDRIAVCTTTYFDGIIAVIDPESSWVARWQRTGTSGASLGLVRSSLIHYIQPSTCEACTRYESRDVFQKTSKRSLRVEVSSTDQETRQIKIEY